MTFSYKDELYHYGVKGMQWGKRKPVETTTKPTARVVRQPPIPVKKVETKPIVQLKQAKTSGYTNEVAKAVKATMDRPGITRAEYEAKLSATRRGIRDQNQKNRFVNAGLARDKAKSDAEAAKKAKEKAAKQKARAVAKAKKILERARNRKLKQEKRARERGRKRALRLLAKKSKSRLSSNGNSKQTK